MDIKAEILKEHSKEQTIKIASYIGNNQNRFDELIALMLKGEKKVAQRAAWIMNYCVEAKPDIINPHIEELLHNLQNPVHDAIKRNTLRALEYIEISEDLMGLIAEICFEFLDSTKESIATRVFSMSALYKVCQKEPGLSNELKLVIEDHYPHGSAGFKSRAKRILKGIEKLEREIE